MALQISLGQIFPDDQKLKNQDFTVNGTDTQENYTESAYQAAGGTDLSSFGPGSPQYQWLEANLQEAQEIRSIDFCTVSPCRIQLRGTWSPYQS